jgi:hypothetical protein
VYGLGIRGRAAGIVEAGALHHRTQVVEGDAAVELQHRSLDHLLELRGVERSGTGEREQMAPGIWSEAPTLMWSENAYRHVSSWESAQGRTLVGADRHHRDSFDTGSGAEVRPFEPPFR